MEFKNPEFLLLLILVVPFLLLLKSKKSGLDKIFKKEIINRVLSKKNSGLSSRFRVIILTLSFVFGVIAIARPQIDNGTLKVKSSYTNMVVGFDISHSMFANDIYPNRFEFAKKKFYSLLKNLKNTKVALIGFSSRAFLIAPLTEDYNSLKFLTKNLGIKYLRLRGTSVMSALESANDLFKDNDKKVLLLFTDGGDKKDFSKEIAYAKEHKITVFIYAVATKKGGIIKSENGILKDKNGNIVVVKRNDAIKELALKTGGAYMVYSLNNKDTQELANLIKRKFKAKIEGETTIKLREELFYYPLGLSILLLFMALFSLPKIRGVK